MPNAYLEILENPAYSHTQVAKIYRPDGLLYKSFSSDQSLGDSDFSSFATSSKLDPPPGTISNFLTTKIPARILLSRQMVGWKVIVEIVSTNGLTTTRDTIFTGVVSKATQQGTSWNLELVSNLINIDKKGSLQFLNNCSRVFGKCGITKSGVWVPITSVGSNSFNFGTNTFITVPNTLYDITVVDTSFPIKNFIGFNGSYAGVLTDQAPLARPDWGFLANTCDNTFTRCKAYANTANYLGAVLPASVLSLDL